MEFYQPVLLFITQVRVLNAVLQTVCRIKMRMFEVKSNTRFYAITNVQTGEYKHKFSYFELHISRKIVLCTV